ncbi:CdaR family protein [Bacillus sp. T3]|uniref:CdaR family protein n=1 Tax=Bacillus sp. T3 TaxID=467262 RepID=UPI002981C615|nr:CdaR family protein [Bacillus sp. T3]
MSRRNVVKATVKVSKQEQKTISNVSIKTEGLADLYDLVFKNPSNGKISISVQGTAEEISPLTAADFNLSVNLTDLNEGDHEVQIISSGPSNVKMKLEQDRVLVSITKKDEV